jgi:hypothetical protein
MKRTQAKFFFWKHKFASSYVLLFEICTLSFTGWSVRENKKRSRKTNIITIEREVYLILPSLVQPKYFSLAFFAAENAREKYSGYTTAYHNWKKKKQWESVLDWFLYLFNPIMKKTKTRLLLPVSKRIFLLKMDMWTIRQRKRYVYRKVGSDIYFNFQK